MSGWCPSSSVCGMAVVCTAAVLPGAVVWLVLYSSHCSAGEYCCHAVHCSLPGVWCVGGECVSVVFVWWGILCVLPPHVGGWWGAVVVVGGMVGEGRLCCRPPRLVCGVPLLLCGGPVEWREWWCCVVPCLLLSVPCLRIGSGTLHCLALSRIAQSLFSLPSLCLLSQHCWFRGVSL